MRSFFHFIGSIGIYLIALGIGLFGTYMVLRTWLFAPANSSDAREIPFIVERGMNFTQVADRLEQQHIARSAFALDLISRLKFDDKRNKIISGEYKLSPSYTPVRLLEIIFNGEVVYYQVTVPPGSRASDLPKIVAETSLLPAEDFQRALNDTALMRELSIPGNSFEGYLFPETYKFSKPVDAKEIITRMVTEGRKRFTNEMLERTVALGFNVHQILTLASIIEKETGYEPDRKLISSVLHNRLKIGMPLQSDPTVIYGLQNFDGNLTREHLRTPGAYNTYLNSELPPTPIANPSFGSIDAALYPAETDYLYFVGKGDGTSQFSVNLREHNEAVKKYQLGKPVIDIAPVPPPPPPTPAAAKKVEPKAEVPDEPVKKKTPRRGLSQLDPVRDRADMPNQGSGDPSRRMPADLEQIMRDIR